MTYIVTEDCIKCKYTTCVDVCPVDCFYEGENMLVINPEQCIDCGVCEPECPIDAIQADTVEASEKWVEHNKKYASIWPNIRLQKEAPYDADQWHKVPDKLVQHFSENPGFGTPKA